MDVKEATKRLEELRKDAQEVINETYEVYSDDELTTAMNDAQALGARRSPAPDVLPALANEAQAERLWDDDRRLFVRNLGWLLSQTRCGVVSCELYGDQDREYVIVRYDHGGKWEIDVTADSYLAIVGDVTKRV